MSKLLYAKGFRLPSYIDFDKRLPILRDKIKTTGIRHKILTILPLTFQFPT